MPQSMPLVLFFEELLLDRGRESADIDFFYNAWRELDSRFSMDRCRLRFMKKEILDSMGIA